MGERTHATIISGPITDRCGLAHSIPSHPSLFSTRGYECTSYTAHKLPYSSRHTNRSTILPLSWDDVIIIMCGGYTPSVATVLNYFQVVQESRPLSSSRLLVLDAVLGGRAGHKK